MSFEWRGRRVVVTGGASFIGSHLVDALCARGASVRVVDDLSSGRLENLAALVTAGDIELTRADLREPDATRAAVRGMEVVFHLAADHGGRGYVDTHQAGPATNLLLDGLVFRESRLAGVERLVYASSGCVYPNHLQQDPSEERYLVEDDVRPPYDSDNMYGYAKLMGELTLRAMSREHGMRTASCRYFTVYGPRAKENHAVMAMIARALLRDDPFEIWGTGHQVRNWTYVDDIVAGTIVAAERIEDGTAVNLGTMERVRVSEAAQLINDYFGYRPVLLRRPDMPTGPVNRVADNSLARRLLDWEPRVPFDEGVRRTIEWYVASKRPDEVRRALAAGGLIERDVSD